MENTWRFKSAVFLALAIACMAGQSLTAATKTEDDYMRELKRGIKVARKIMSIKSLGTVERSQYLLWQQVLSNITQLMQQQQVINELVDKAHRKMDSGSGDRNSSNYGDANMENLIAMKVVMEETINQICPWLQAVANYQFTDGTPFNCTKEEIAVLGLRLRLASTANNIYRRLTDVMLTNRLNDCDWIRDKLICNLSTEALDFITGHYRCDSNFTQEYVQSYCSSSS